MQTVHLYLRTQLRATDEQAQAIAEAADALRVAIEAAGGTWGSVQVVPDVVEPVAEPAGTAEPAEVPDHLAEEPVPVPDV